MVGTTRQPCLAHAKVGSFNCSGLSWGNRARRPSLGIGLRGHGWVGLPSPPTCPL